MMNLNQLYRNGTVFEIDRQFARLMARYVEQDKDIVQIAAALVSRTTALGNVCLDLNRAIHVEGTTGDGDARDCVIEPSEWKRALNRSPVVGRPGEFKPMIMDRSRLYLHRHWQYEQNVAQGIRQRCRNITSNDGIHSELADDLRRLFPEGDDRQRDAVLSALTQGFTVISGGPGTGKTYTIAKLIVLMQKINTGSDLRLKLAAPTGKAAMRLQQSIETAMAAMGYDQAVQQFAGDNTQTLHRMLGARVGRSGYHYHAGNQLPVDVVMVDEASMIDLALMNALMAALAPESRLVLIGDMNQLASVEAGAILGDICRDVSDGSRSVMPTNRSSVRDNALEDRIVVLRHGYRFANKSGIDDLAAAVNAGETQSALDVLRNQANTDVALKEIEDPGGLQMAVASLTKASIAPGFATPNPLEALARMERLMILSPLRNGPYGMHAINGYVEQTLIKLGHKHIGGPLDDSWYAGRPVMVTCNDYYHNLFNGDLGIALKNSEATDASLSVFLPDGGDGFRQVRPQQLPAHQTAFAMTVHKSQGSEFDRVILVLPDRESAILTRELVYTAITRARGGVEIWGSERSLEIAIRQRIHRSSGLGDLLWAERTKLDATNP